MIREKNFPPNEGTKGIVDLAGAIYLTFAGEKKMREKMGPLPAKLKKRRETWDLCRRRNVTGKTISFSVEITFCAGISYTFSSVYLLHKKKYKFL